MRNIEDMVIFTNKERNHTKTNVLEETQNMTAEKPEDILSDFIIGIN